jgi:hypothetical protein
VEGHDAEKLNGAGIARRCIDLTGATLEQGFAEREAEAAIRTGYQGNGLLDSHGSPLDGS